MKKTVSILSFLSVLSGCSATSLIKQEKEIVSQNIFITSWGDSFDLKEAECLNDKVPHLMWTRVNSNGSKTLILKCIGA